MVPEGFSTWVDAFLSQDNYGANTGNNNRSNEPGNQLAGIDLRWKVIDAPIAFMDNWLEKMKISFFQIA